jgi:hypothetical protein
MTSKTYAELAVATDLQGGDLLATFRGLGPLKSLTASLAKDYFQTGVVLADGSVAMTGALAVYVGSESLPGVAFSGDADTGIYRVGANSLGIATGGVNRMTVDSSGVTATAFIGPLTGNAATATKWATARNLALTGDGTATFASVDGSAAVSTALTFATVNSNVGSYGSASAVATLTVNGKGLVTAAGQTTISITDANLSAAVSVAKGGTGDTTLTAHGVLIGQGASPVAVTTAGTVAYPLVSGGAGADPAFALLSVAGGGTGAVTFTDGGVLIGNATGAVQVTTAGTAGQVLTSNGAGVDPSFKAPGVGSTVYLETLTASNSASLASTTALTSTYNAYMFIFDNIVPATTGANFLCQFSINAGSSYLSTNYSPNTDAVYVVASPGIDNTTSLGGASGQMLLSNPNSATRPKMASGSVGYYQNGVSVASRSIAGSYVGATTAVNAIRFLMGSGNITSGSIYIYGIATS